MPNCRILVVEDEFLIRLTLVEALTEYGFDVLEAASGDEALEVLRGAGEIGLLLTDIQLPGGLDGIALARQARHSTPELPVIYLTGRPETADGNSEDGRDATITKPYQPSDVYATVLRMIGR